MQFLPYRLQMRRNLLALAKESAKTPQKKMRLGSAHWTGEEGIKARLLPFLDTLNKKKKLFGARLHILPLPFLQGRNSLHRENKNVQLIEGSSFALQKSDVERKVVCDDEKTHPKAFTKCTSSHSISSGRDEGANTTTNQSLWRSHDTERTTVEAPDVGK